MLHLDKVRRLGLATVYDEHLVARGNQRFDRSAADEPRAPKDDESHRSMLSKPSIDKAPDLALECPAASTP
jgi:hypothetical protein